MFYDAVLTSSFISFVYNLCDTRCTLVGTNFHNVIG